MFKQSFYLKVFLIFLCLCFSGLGLWQIERAKLKYNLQKRFSQSLQQKTSIIQDTNGLTENDQYKKITLQGHFDNTHQFLLAHQFYQHQLGYHVITPFILKSKKQAILVDRGWIPEQEKNLSIQSGAIEIIGLVHFPKQNAFVLGPVIEPSSTWPKKIQRIQYTVLQAVLPYQIATSVILLDPNLPNGFERAWSFSAISYHRHIGYAIQWFIFALIALGSVVYMQWKK